MNKKTKIEGGHDYSSRVEEIFIVDVEKAGRRKSPG